jgi:hypothetical protein
MMDRWEMDYNDAPHGSGYLSLLPERGVYLDIFGGGGASAATQAGSMEAQAAQQAAQLQYQMYQQYLQQVAPWQQPGAAASTQLAGLAGLPGYQAQDPTATLQATPGYQWGLGQGLAALQKYGAATGMGQSGAALKGATTYGTNYATQQAWQPYLQQLQSISGSGLTAATGAGQAGLDTGAAMGQDYMSAAQAQAQALMQAQNAQATGMGNLFGGLGMAAGYLLGGPLGGLVGDAAGSMFGKGVG